MMGDSQSSLDLDTRDGYSNPNYFRIPLAIEFANPNVPLPREMASPRYQKDLINALSLCKLSYIIKNKVG